MPTTRLSTVKPNSSVSEIATPVFESFDESQTSSFDSRKKYERPDNLSPKQITMIQFIESLIDADKKHLLWIKKSDPNSITIESIVERIYGTKYSDFNSLKTDLVSLFSSIIPLIRQHRAEIETLHKLYVFMNNSLTLESSRLNETLTESKPIFEFVSLFKSAIDGYAFTDAIIKDSSTGPIFNYPPSVQELIVHPAQPVEKERVPTLKAVVAPPPKYHSKISRYEDKPVVPVQWLDFGAFSSFAPTTDSNNASTTYENTYMGRSAKRFKKLESEPVAMDVEFDKEESEKWLLSQGIDIKVIEEAIDKQPENTDEELERNSRLLEELIRYQNVRFNENKTKISDINEKEIEIAKTLEKNIASMISKLPPNAVASDSTIIENAMNRLPLLESAYRGTLPPHKIFSFPTTEKAEVLPPYANITPTYAKENWRLVKVAPLKEAGDQTILSMVEQQQMNFYQKQSYPAQSQPQQPQRQVQGSQYVYQQQSQQRRQ